MNWAEKAIIRILFYITKTLSKYSDKIYEIDLFALEKKIFEEEGKN